MFTTALSIIPKIVNLNIYQQMKKMWNTYTVYTWYYSASLAANPITYDTMAEPERHYIKYARSGSIETQTVYDLTICLLECKKSQISQEESTMVVTMAWDVE